MIVTAQWNYMLEKNRIIWNFTFIYEVTSSIRKSPNIEHMVVATSCADAIFSPSQGMPSC